MKLKYIIFFLPLLVLAVDLAVSNNEKIVISLWPVPFEAEMFLGFALILFFTLGFVFNGVMNVLKSIKTSSKIILLEKENKKLKEEIAKNKQSN